MNRLPTACFLVLLFLFLVASEHGQCCNGATAAMRSDALNNNDHNQSFSSKLGTYSSNLASSSSPILTFAVPLVLIN